MPTSDVPVAGSGKRRFVTLDALRGIGAVFVMAGHSGEVVHGYIPAFFQLAVDMFFVLSGFVIAHAYDGKFASGMTRREFFLARIRRLYPIYLIGLVLGLISILFTNEHGLSFREAAISFTTSFFGLPSPPMGPYRALFPLNGPYWSLFFEFWVANLISGLFWKSLRGALLGTIIFASAAILIFSAVHFKTVDLGWDWSSFAGGFPRVCFSFFAGVALSRFHKIRPPNVNVPSVLCLLTFIVFMGLRYHGVLTPIYELFVLMLFFPLLIYFGAEASERRPAMGLAIGDASYALYAIHRPLLYIFVWPVSLLAFPLLQKPYSYCVQAAFMVLIAGMAWRLNRMLAGKHR
jgi:peptidoglycan/LPS O-acetylase OafA/YrhL